MNQTAQALTPSELDSKDPFIPFRERAVYFLFLATVGSFLYFPPQLFPLKEPIQLTMTSLDVAIPFNPAWSWMYQTVYLVTPIVALTLGDRSIFMKYFTGYLLMICFCSICFFVFPVEGPRSLFEVEKVQDVMYQIILKYDGETNCMPSLHVALALYSWLYFSFTIKAFSWPRIPAHFLMGTWFLLLCYSSLALKQHYVVDVPMGVFVALFAYVLSRRRKVNC